MKHLLFSAMAVFILTGCSTSTTNVVSYDAEGNAVSSQTTTITRNDTTASAKKLGGDVKDGIVSGYEWTKDKTIEGYRWVKNKTVKTYDSLTD